MTNEEAIEIIEAYKDRLTNSCSNQLDKDIRAFELAIKGILTLDSLKAKKEFERPQGEWIDRHHENRGNVCSFCNESLPCTDEYDYYTNFCPNCGADMRGKQSEEN